MNVRTISAEEFTILKLKYDIEYFDYPISLKETVKGPFLIHNVRSGSFQVICPYPTGLRRTFYIHYNNGIEDVDIFLYNDNYYLQSGDTIFCIYFDKDNVTQMNAINLILKRNLARGKT